ncbi:MAG: hypothetical protein Fur0011_2000 [Candidatus Microgenomates bacterium]
MRKKLIIIIISILLLVTGTYLISNQLSNQANNNSIPQKTSQITGTPIDHAAVKETIKNTEKVTHCLLTKDNYRSEYYINKENILTKNTNSIEGSDISFYSLKIENEVYNWDNLSKSGTNFTIPSSEQIKSNPTLKEYLKLIPNTYSFDIESITELQEQGFKVECELIDYNSQLFKIPDIAFSYLKKVPTSAPSSTQ